MKLLFMEIYYQTFSVFCFKLNANVEELDRELLQIKEVIRCYLSKQEVAPFVCSLCHREYTKSHNMQRHIREAHFKFFAANPDLDLTCGNCGRLFTRTYARDVVTHIWDETSVGFISGWTSQGLWLFNDGLRIVFRLSIMYIKYSFNRSRYNK